MGLHVLELGLACLSRVYMIFTRVLGFILQILSRVCTGTVLMLMFTVDVSIIGLHGLGISRV